VVKRQVCEVAVAAGNVHWGGGGKGRLRRNGRRELWPRRRYPLTCPLSAALSTHYMHSPHFHLGIDVHTNSIGCARLSSHSISPWPRDMRT